MALFLKEIFELHSETLRKYRDTRSDDWAFMSSFWKPGLIIAAHLCFVLVLGPKFMAKRKPFNLDRILLVYNAIQVLACSLIFVMCTIHLIPYYNLRCEPVDYSNSYRGILAAKVLWYYYLTKLLDLFDTIFFVLRKKYNQVTFLHVYHHEGMIIASWIAARFVSGGVPIYVAYLNALVHIVMYGYYFLTVYKKDFSHNIGLKKLITGLQILQFGLICLFFIIVLASEDCGYPKWTVMLMFPQNAFMFCLFVDFYSTSYIIKDVAKSAAAKAS